VSNEDKHEADRKLRHLRERMRKETEDEATSILTLAGLRPERMWELANGYWPDAPAYDEVRCPWWLAMTRIGLIRIGWRKRVIAIDWDATKVRVIVTSDDVTKGDTMVHAWSIAKAVEYLTAIAKLSPAEPSGT
jgi:hypothetical protein